MYELILWSIAVQAESTEGYLNKFGDAAFKRMKPRCHRALWIGITSMCDLVK